jgi:magnesium transporter
VGCVLMMQHFEAAIATTVALTFFIPAIMAMGGNTGIQTSSVVVRGLATGEVDVYHIGRYLTRELGTALMTGGLISLCLFLIAGLVVGNRDLAVVLTLSMFTVIVCAALIGTAIPLMLYKFGIDPAIATGPFITTSNDIIAILIYLGMASLMLQ